MQAEREVQGKLWKARGMWKKKLLMDGRSRLLELRVKTLPTRGRVAEDRRVSVHAGSRVKSLHSYILPSTCPFHSFIYIN
jgi:hypothetical protein